MGRRTPRLRAGTQLVHARGSQGPCQQGPAQSRCHVGQRTGTDKDEGESVKWHSRTAEQGLAEAQLALALKDYQGKRMYLAVRESECES